MLSLFLNKIFNKTHDYIFGLFAKSRKIDRIDCLRGRGLPFDVAARRLAEINPHGLDDTSCKMQFAKIEKSATSRCVYA